MDKYEAVTEIRKTILPSVKGTKWEEPIKIALKALEHEIWAEEDVCESCKVNPVKIDLQEMFGRNG